MRNQGGHIEMLVSLEPILHLVSDRLDKHAKQLAKESTQNRCRHMDTLVAFKITIVGLGMTQINIEGLLNHGPQLDCLFESD